MVAVSRLSAAVAALLLAAAAEPFAGGATLRLHGSVEPIHSSPVFVPRLSGSNANSVVIIHLARAGTQVKKGDLLVEFDSQAQIKTAHDREAEYRDFVEQINKMRADQLAARAHDDAALRQGENAVKSAQIDVSTNEVRARIDGEKNQLMLEEMRAHLAALQRTSDLRRKAEAADLRLLEIERDRARNAWTHAQQNATKMRIVSPLDGLVVLKTTWKNGSFGEVQEGEDTRPGVPIMEVVDSTAMRIRAKINQADVERMRVGQAATITLDSYPSREFHGRLEQLSPIATTSALSAKVRTFLGIFSVSEPDPHLLPDLAAAIDVDVSKP
ncbi:MAG TPA: efflux RND transporter periplasmic adaptor subunit [Vicinamibacterales bacterium]|nr:efflux RND transporter periplasmic adaptor subunit [Vicinamibacterales bacterium]